METVSGVGRKGRSAAASKKKKKKLSARSCALATTNERGRLLRDPPRHGPAPVCVGGLRIDEKMPSKGTPVSFRGWPSALTT